MIEHSMTIGGSSVGTDDRLPVVDPATEQVIGNTPVCTTDILDQAVEAARLALPDWSADLQRRRHAMRAAAGVIDANVDELGALLTAEQGKPLAEARSEVARAGDRLRYWADLEYDLSPLADDSRGLVTEVTLQPLGVVSVITPWNYPVGMAMSRLAPALFVGNTTILKPSPFAPLTVLRMGQLLATALPPGVLNVVSGTDELGAWMSQHPTVRAISFTGSIATGKKVAASAAPDLKRAVLELGGNDPAIVLDDVDPLRVADAVVPKAFSNCGQICYAVKRIYVPRASYRTVVEALANRVAKIAMGAGTEPGVEMGPLNNAPQLRRIEDLMADAVASGARAVQGGGRVARPGYFFEPTVLADCEDGMAVVDEEQFGPVLPVVAYDDLDDAVERANRTMFGLGGSVWGNDVEKARQAATRLESATTWVNTHGVVGFGQPHTGSRWSGSGITGGTWLGLIGVSDLRVLAVQPGVDLS